MTLLTGIATCMERVVYHRGNTGDSSTCRRLGGGLAQVPGLKKVHERTDDAGAQCAGPLADAHPASSRKEAATLSGQPPSVPPAHVTERRCWRRLGHRSFRCTANFIRLASEPHGEGWKAAIELVVDERGAIAILAGVVPCVRFGAGVVHQRGLRARSVRSAGSSAGRSSVSSWSISTKPQLSRCARQGKRL